MRILCFSLLLIAGLVMYSAVGCSGNHSPVDPGDAGATDPHLATVASVVAGVQIQNTVLSGVLLNGVNLLPWGYKIMPLAPEGTYPLAVQLENKKQNIKVRIDGATLLQDGKPITEYSGVANMNLNISSISKEITIHIEVASGGRETSKTRDITVHTEATTDLPIPARLGVVKYTDAETGMTFDIADRELEVGVNTGTPVAAVEGLVNALDCELLRAIPNIDVYRIRIPVSADYTQFIGLFKDSSIVRNAEINAIYYPALVPNDTYHSQEYEATVCHQHEAWDITTGTSDTIISIIDSGVMRDHPDLIDNIINGEDFVTPIGDGLGGAVPGDGVDNDGDGDTDGNVEHGTHCAGIAAAVGNNNEGVSGHTWHSKILPLRIFPANGDGGAEDSAVAEAITYAADNGADVISLSIGGPYGSNTEQNAISYAWGKNVVIVAAAGNSGSSQKSYPAAFTYVIAVAATDSSDHVANWSNYGSWVDCSAPGVEIISSIFYEYSGSPNNTPENQRYAVYNGTSMACPQVAGLAGLVASNYPDYTNQDISDQVIFTSDNIDANNPGYEGLIGKGRINDFKAVSTSVEASFSVVALSADDDNPLFSQGNRDGFLNPGETFEFRPTIVNDGLKTASLCTMSLIPADSKIQVLKDTSYLGSVLKGETVVPDEPFIFRINPDVPDNTDVSVTLHFTYSNGVPIDVNYSFKVRKDLQSVDTITCGGAGLLSGELAKGMTGIVPLKFTISSDVNYGTLEELTVHQTGTALPDSFGEVQLWLDANDDGQFSKTYDQRVAYQSYDNPGYRGHFDDLNDPEAGFSKGIGYEPLPAVYFDALGLAHFQDIVVPTAPGVARTLFVVFDLTPVAVSGTTVQIGVLSSSDVVVKAPDQVSLDGFPIQTSEVPIIGKWLDPIQLTTTSPGTDQRTSWRPETAVDPTNGFIYVVYDSNENNNYDVFLKRSTDHGATFDAPVQIDDSVASEWYPDIQVDSKGVIHVVFYSTKISTNNREIYYARSTDHGQSFETDVRLTNAVNDSRVPKLAIGPDDSLNVAWHDNRNAQNNYDIFFMRSEDGGDTWLPTVQVCATNPNSQEAAIAVGGDGVIHITWEELGNYNSGNAYYSRSIDNGLTWSAPYKITTGSYNNRGWYTDVGADNAGNAVVVFQNVPQGADSEIAAITSSDSGATWSAIKLLTDNSISDSRPGMSVMADGSYIDIVFRRNEAQNWNIYHMHSEDLLATWSTPTKISLSDWGGARAAVVVRDSNFNIYAFWEDMINSNQDYEVFFNRFIF
jgi:thermitase